MNLNNTEIGSNISIVKSNLSLHDIGIKHNTDKAYLHNYLIFYEKHLSKYKNEKIRLLEIGIGQGSSLRMWEEYFPNAKIYGVDINKSCLKYTYKSDRVKTIIGNQSSRDFLKSIEGEFDVIIDDGGHTMNQQTVSFGCLFSKLKQDGIYIIENIHTSLMPEYGGNLKNANTVLSNLSDLKTQGCIDSKYLLPHEKEYIESYVGEIIIYGFRDFSDNNNDITSIIKKSLLKNEIKTQIKPIISQPNNNILFIENKQSKEIKEKIKYDKKFFISIVCHNKIEYTKKCLDKVKKYSNDYELLIMDNNSTDETREYFNSDYKIIHYNENKGFGVRHNEAYEKSNSEYFVVLNNDVEVCSDWLNEMEREFDNPKVALVGIKNTCCGLDNEGNGIPSAKIEYAEASCLMVKREYVDVLFSEEFKFAYYEDSDLSLRMREKGYEIKLVDLPIIHHRGKTSEIVKEDLAGYKLRNKIIFNNKWRHYLKNRKFDKNILIKRQEALGDVLLVTSILEPLKIKYPSSNIYIETNHPEIFTNNPHVFSTCLSAPKISFDLTYDLNLSYEKEPNKHIIQAYADVCEVEPKWDIDIYAEQKYSAINEEDYIVMHPGKTAWEGRNLDINKFNSVSKSLRQMGFKIVIIGNSPSLPFECDYDFRNKTTFYQLSYIIRRAKLFIGIDSFPMHIAQAFKIPLVSVFGCILPEYRLLPNEIFKGIISKNIGCIGCHHYQSAPRTHSNCLRDKTYCMDSITAHTILEESKKLLKIN